MGARVRLPGKVLAVLAVALVLAPAARAATIEVPATAGALAAAVAAARPGDVLRLEAGRHQGHLELTRPLTIEGLPGAVVEGGGTGSVLKVTAPDVAVRGLTIKGSGTRPTDFDAAIYVEQGATGFLAEDNILEGNLFGIVLHGADRAIVRRNRIANRTDRYETERGNAIHLWNVHESTIAGNVVTSGRDGIFIEISHRNTIEGNHAEGVRFGYHSMYGNDTTVTGNTSAGNTIGYALMYSNNLVVRRNLSLNDRQHGLMLHTVHHSDIVDNRVRGTEDKGVFIYTSAINQFHGNRIENCGLGLHFTGGSEKNRVWDNAFIGNRSQIKFTGTQVYEWSKDGRGNYWSDNTAFDLGGDGLADTAYRPNSVMDRIMWRYPLAKMLMSSPVMEALKVAQGRFPALMPGGVVDSHPLMAPPPAAVPLPDPGARS